MERLRKNLSFRGSLIAAAFILSGIVSCEGTVPEDEPGTGGRQDTTVVTPAADSIEVIPAANSTIYGFVSCGGKGVGGVVVSDGYEVTTTGPNGVYQLESGKKNGYAFISIPSGYRVPQDGIIPQFFHYCQTSSTEAERMDFSLETANQKTFNVLFFGDMHLTGRTSQKDVAQFREFAAEVSDFAENEPNTYAVTLGDMSWDYFWSESNYGLPEYLAEANADLGGLPVFHTMGNHDNDPTMAGDFAGAGTYIRTIGPNYYSFNIGGVHFMVVDDIVYRNSPLGERNFYRELPQEQLDWIKKDLAYVPKYSTVVVTSHAPFYTSEGGFSLYNCWDFLKLFYGYSQVRLVTGHTHVIYNVDKTSMSVHAYEHNSGAVCGAWWKCGALADGMNISSDGAPAGYRIMTFSDGKLSDNRYKGSGCEDDCQFRAYDRNAIDLSPDKIIPNATEATKADYLEKIGEYAAPSSDNYVYINVWDYDPAWTVSATENGKPLNVEKISTKDPLYLLIYEVHYYKKGYTINYPASDNAHMFRAKASAPDTPVQITVTDSYGREYSSTFARPHKFEISR